MLEGLLWVLFFAETLCGTSCVAVSLEPHWEQVRAPSPYPLAHVTRLRLAGALALASSLALLFVLNEPSVAPLIWVMALTLSALLVAMTLAYRPRWLSWIVAWVR